MSYTSSYDVVSYICPTRGSGGAEKLAVMDEEALDGGEWQGGVSLTISGRPHRFRLGVNHLLRVGRRIHVLHLDTGE